MVICTALPCGIRSSRAPQPVRVNHVIHVVLAPEGTPSIKLLITSCRARPTDSFLTPTPAASGKSGKQRTHAGRRAPRCRYSTPSRSPEMSATHTRIDNLGAVRTAEASVPPSRLATNRAGRCACSTPSAQGRITLRVARQPTAANLPGGILLPLPTNRVAHAARCPRRISHSVSRLFASGTECTTAQEEPPLPGVPRSGPLDAAPRMHPRPRCDVPGPASIARNRWVLRVPTCPDMSRHLSVGSQVHVTRGARIGEPIRAPTFHISISVGESSGGFALSRTVLPYGSTANPKRVRCRRAQASIYSTSSEDHLILPKGS